MNGNPLFEAFADGDGLGWDPDTGAPTVSMFANALQVWSACQNRQVVSVAEACLAFNVHPELVREAVHVHPWLTLENDAIEHEGE